MEGGLEGGLDVIGVRVLGSLIEKESTTPDNYPLTLNALTAACNQTSNRDPVLQLDEASVAKSLEDLIRRNLVRAVHRSDTRVRRYRHALRETLHLHAAETAALGVLMLRGPQTTGEIRTRTTRLHEFGDLVQVELTLQSLMGLDPPLVAVLPRRPGQKEARYAQLLSGVPVVDDAAPDSAEHAGSERAGTSRIDALEQEVAALRAELAELQTRFTEFMEQFR